MGFDASFVKTIFEFCIGYPPLIWEQRATVGNALQAQAGVLFA